MERITQTILSGIFDYAGLFPPARLPLKEALREYMKTRHSKYDWLLARFVILHHQLEELEQMAALEQPVLPDPLRLAITAAGTATASDFIKQLTDIKKAINRGHKKLPVILKTDVLEIKLPEDVLPSGSQDNIRQLLKHAIQEMSGNRIWPDSIFFEIPGVEFNPAHSDLLLQILADINSGLEHEDYSFFNRVGLKIRCGGLEAFQFPPTEYLARVLSQAARLDVPLKFTAGLHHPIRHYNAAVKTDMHGFLNVFCAAFIAAAHHPGADKINEILNDTDAGNFRFTPDAFFWKNLSVSIREVRELRRDTFTTIGSCSISEPVEDLTNLNLIV